MAYMTKKTYYIILFYWMKEILIIVLGIEMSKNKKYDVTAL